MDKSPLRRAFLHPASQSAELDDWLRCGGDFGSSPGWRRISIVVISQKIK